MHTLAAIGLTFLFFAAYVFVASMCKAAGKKQPKPGKDYDERGPF